jgi:hypothetical protein
MGLCAYIGCGVVNTAYNLIQAVNPIGTAQANELTPEQRLQATEAAALGTETDAQAMASGQGIAPLGGSAQAAPPVPGPGGGAQSAGAAAGLAQQLTAQVAASVFTAGGALGGDALAGSREIIPSSQLGNPALPSGISKFATQTYQSPAGDFQVHFYMNLLTGEPYYGQDYKTIFNSGKVAQ